MGIRARVGRHAKLGGRHCQNHRDDQRVVIDLLNAIPVHEGGAGGALAGAIVDGVAADALYRAIFAFENKHFPGQASGFVDPGGPLFARLTTLAKKPMAVAPSAPATAAAKPVETRVEALLRRAPRELAGNLNAAAVAHFLAKLKVDGYADPIQNDRILGYLFGLAQWAQDGRPRDLDKIFWDGLSPHVGRSPLQPERMHAGTPIYSGNVIRVENGEAAILTNEGFMRLRAPFELRLLGGVAKPAHSSAMRTDEERRVLRKALEKLDRR